MFSQNRIDRQRSLRLSVTLFLIAASLTGAFADKAGDKKRAQLANVRRLVVVPLFFGTETLGKVTDPDKALDRAVESALEKGKPKPPAKPDPNLALYKEHLLKLEDLSAARLPVRVATRTPFQVVAADDLTAALKDLGLTPQKLFKENGRIRGSRFALPDPEAVHKLAARLQADAVLLGTMDEPRRTNGQTYLDMFGLVTTPGFVRAKAGIFVVLPDGTEVLHAYVESLHPLTPTNKPAHLLADWQEATEQVIEDFLDELTRYTPEKR